MKMYKVNTMFRYSTGLKSVNVERTTDKCVYVDGHRENKESHYGKYFTEFDAAKLFALNKAEIILRGAKEALETAQSSLDKIKETTVDNCKHKDY